MASDKMRKDRKKGKSTGNLTQSDIMDNMLSGNMVEIPDPMAFNQMGLSSAIVKHDDGALEINSIKVHRTGLEFVGSVTEEDYQLFGETLLQIETAYQWIVGDYLAYGVDNNYGMAKEFAEKLGRDPSTVRDWTYVCNQIELSYRYDNLSFKHHRMVAPMDSQQQKYWLREASENRWSTSKLQKMIAEAQGDALPAKVTEPMYKKWAEQSQNRVELAVEKYQGETDGRKRNAWKRYIESEVERWQQALASLEDK